MSVKYSSSGQPFSLNAVRFLFLLNWIELPRLEGVIYSTLREVPCVSIAVEITGAPRRTPHSWTAQGTAFFQTRTKSVSGPCGGPDRRYVDLQYAFLLTRNHMLD